MYDSRALSSRLVCGYRWYKTADLPKNYQVTLRALMREFARDRTLELPQYVRATLKPLHIFHKDLLFFRRIMRSGSSWNDRHAADMVKVTTFEKLFEVGADFPPLVYSCAGRAGRGWPHVGLEEGVKRGIALINLGWRRYYFIELSDLVALSRGRVRIPKRYNAPRKRSSARRQRPVSHAVH